MSTTGDATDFGNLTLARSYEGHCIASRTRGIWTGGYDAPAVTDRIDFVTIASTGNATDFGNLATARDHPSN